MVTLRPFKNEDYNYCEALVNQAWGFDRIFPSPALSALAKRIYTKGSYFHSNYRLVATDKNKVVGFIMGYCNRLPKQRGATWFGIKMLARLLLAKSTGTPSKSDLLNAIGDHETNRAKLFTKGSNEIVLFVIDEQYRGQGVGTQLWQGFREFCLEHSASEAIFVETNKKGASGFYETLGFIHEFDFESPLHGLATPDGQACVYRYRTESR